MTILHLQAKKLMSRHKQIVNHVAVRVGRASRARENEARGTVAPNVSSIPVKVATSQLQRRSVLS